MIPLESPRSGMNHTVYRLLCAESKQTIDTINTRLHKCSYSLIQPQLIRLQYTRITNTAEQTETLNHRTAKLKHMTDLL